MEIHQQYLMRFVQQLMGVLDIVEKGSRGQQKTFWPQNLQGNTQKQLWMQTSLFVFSSARAVSSDSAPSAKWEYFSSRRHCTSGHTLFVCTTVGSLCSTLLDPLPRCRKYLALLKLQCLHRIHPCKYPLLSFWLSIWVRPSSIWHGNTHASLSMIVCPCMMCVSLFGWGRHI